MLCFPGNSDIERNVVADEPAKAGVAGICWSQTHHRDYIDLQSYRSAEAYEIYCFRIHWWNLYVTRWFFISCM